MIINGRKVEKPDRCPEDIWSLVKSAFSRIVVYAPHAWVQYGENYVQINALTEVHRARWTFKYTTGRTMFKMARHIGDTPFQEESLLHAPTHTFMSPEGGFQLSLHRFEEVMGGEESQPMPKLAQGGVVNLKGKVPRIAMVGDTGKVEWVQPPILAPVVYSPQEIDMMKKVLALSPQTFSAGIN